MIRFILLTISNLFIAHFLSAQNIIKVDSEIFGNCEVIEAQVSDKSLIVNISEYNMTDFNFENLPNLDQQALVLSIEVANIRGLSFPISPTDNFKVSLSGLQSRLAENKFQIDQVNNQKINAAKLKEEAEGLNSEKKSVEEQSREISQQLMDGKITPDEAAKRIEALSSGLLAKVENSEELNNETQEFDEKTSYTISFYNLEALEHTRLVDGVLNIKVFNEKEFIAEFKGRSVTECLERRSTSSLEEKEKCGSVNSTLLPDTKVLREQQIQGSVNITIKRFEDNR